MKLLRTKAAAYMAAEGVAKLTILPALKLADKVGDKYRDTKATLEVRYIKANLENMTAQEKFDATIKHRSELVWTNDPIIESANTLIYILRHPEKPDAKHRFEIAYAYLSSSGVTQFTPDIDAYYMLNIEKISRINA